MPLTGSPFLTIPPALDRPRRILVGWRLRLAAGVALAAVLGGGALAQGPTPTFDPPVPGQGSAGVAQSRTSSRAAAILLDQANYWSAQGRPAMALSALERLIALEPNNPEVLATAAEVAIQSGDRAVAEGYLARVTQIAPNSPAAQRASAALRASSVDQAALGEARRLAQAGQREAAMQRYREIFPNNEVPDAYAAEYYQTLASVSSENFREAINALRAAVARQPENRSLQLSYAQLLTYREITRAEGVDRLIALSALSDIASGARAAWRQALLWQGPSGEAEEQINVYLRRFPDDQEIIAKLAEIRAVTADPVAEARIRGFELMRDGKNSEAETVFNTLLETDANEPTGLLGLAMVRRRQSREVEARELLERATAAAPDRRAEFLDSLGYTEESLRLGLGLPGRGYAVNQGGGRGFRGRGGVDPNYVPPSVPARRALGAGRLDEALRGADRAARGDVGQRIEAAIIRGQVALQRRDFQTAEARFREALALRRSLPEAQDGLYNAINGRNPAEAATYAASVGLRPGAGGGSGGAENFQRAARLRDEAVRETDTDVQISLLRAAAAAVPGEVWPQHDLARVLKTRGQRAEGLQIERALLARRTNDSMYAAALLASQDGRTADVVARLEAIPARALTADGRRLLDYSRSLLEIQRLTPQARGNPDGEAARRLIAIAARPDASGEIPATVVRAFGSLRQQGNAEAAARAGGSDNASASVRARAVVAAALVDAGERDDAVATVRAVERDPRLALDSVRQPVGTRAAAPAQRENALTAYDPLDNRRPQLSVARVYANSGRTEEGLQIAENILAQNPGNTEARSVAGEAAVLNGSVGRAEQILREGRSLGADELQMALLEARIARARRDPIRARRALEEAARLRGDQLRAGG